MTAARILFVEDNEATRYAVNRVLTGAGYRIATAETGEKGLALAHDFEPDLLLLDVKLPDMSGFELVRRLKADPATASIPIVHLSASHLSSEDQIRGLQGGADAYLTHPVEPRVLVATLAALLRVRLAEARYRRLFETRLLGILQWRRDGVVTDANDAFLEIAGLSRAALEAGAVQWKELDPVGWSSRQAARNGSSRAAGEAVEAELVRKDGTRVPVLLGEALLGDDGGEGVSFVLDISDRKRAEEALQEADRRKDEFLAVLSHELRNPLAPIRTSIAILERVEPRSEQATRAREVISRQVDHLTQLVDDLLDVTRIARGKVQVRRVAVDLAEILRRTVEDHAGLLERERIAFDGRTPDAPVWVVGDPTRLAQVLGNLVGNATKFSDPGGRVGVSLEREGDAAVVRVRDRGIGIAPDMLARLFVPFEQADETLARTRSRGGLGLGLALVKTLVELHGGTVEAHSAGLGEGAEFVVRLPLAPPGVAPEAPEVERPSRRRVLIVEDNADAGETLRDLLHLEGHEVALAGTGEEGLRLVGSFRPHVVLCDLGLPGMDGYEFARKLRQDPTFRGTALVALSGYGLPEDRKRAEEAGFHRHVRKPATIDDLQRAIDTAPAEAPTPAEH